MSSCDQHHQEANNELSSLIGQGKKKPLDMATIVKVETSNSKLSSNNVPLSTSYQCDQASQHHLAACKWEEKSSLTSHSKKNYAHLVSRTYIMHGIRVHLIPAYFH